VLAAKNILLLKKKINKQIFFQRKKILNQKTPLMAFEKGYEEETFLEAMGVPIEKMEFLADNCTKVICLKVFNVKSL
jgi:hypothetical protein